MFGREKLLQLKGEQRKIGNESNVCLRYMFSEELGKNQKNLYIYFFLTNGGKIRKICRIIKSYHEISKSLANNRLK